MWAVDPRVCEERSTIRGICITVDFVVKAVRRRDGRQRNCLNGDRTPKCCPGLVGLLGLVPQLEDGGRRTVTVDPVAYGAGIKSAATSPLQRTRSRRLYACVFNSVLSPFGSDAQLAANPFPRFWDYCFLISIFPKDVCRSTRFPPPFRSV